MTKKTQETNNPTTSSKIQDVKNKISENSKTACCCCKTKLKEAVEYTKANYKNKNFITKAIAGVVLVIIALTLLCTVFCDNKTVRYHYEGGNYIKETLIGDKIVKRQWCQVNKFESRASKDKLVYYCSRELVEFSR